MATTTRRARKSPRPSAARAYTLIEVLVVVTVLGIAAAVLVPSMGQTGVLRVQSAVRTVISDISFAQSDALAYQVRRAIVFDIDANAYTIYEVKGDAPFPEEDVLIDRTREGGRARVGLNDPRFAGATITDVSFDGGSILTFDEIGGPVETPTGDTPSVGGYVEISGSGSVFRVNVEAYTGRVSVERIGG
jgi:prepilin-type N-terminal cleavage/methylation domain-containing protein